MGNFNNSDGFDIFFDYRRGAVGNPTLVFLHGWPHNHTTWGRLIAHFKDGGYPILAIDFRGSGFSSKMPGKQLYSIESAEQDLVQLIHKTGVRDYVLLGHSFGAMVAIGHAVSGPRREMRGMVLCSAGYRSPYRTLFGMDLHQMTGVLNALFSAYAFLFYTVFKRQKAYDFAGLTRLPTVLLHALGMRGASRDSVTGYLHSMTRGFDLSDKLAGICVPMLVFGGSRDFIQPAKNGRHIATKAMNAEFMEISGDHTLMLKKSATIAPLIEEFLRKLKELPEKNGMAKP